MTDLMPTRVVTIRQRFQGSTVIAVLFAVSAMLALPGSAQTEKTEAPFGDKVSERIPFYHRAAPTIATAGSLGRLGLIEAKGVGFKSVLSLIGSGEVAAEDKKLAEFVVLRYFRVPVVDLLPTEKQIAEIRNILEDPDNAPILIYGSEVDQAAAAWTLVRAAEGVPANIALQEGRTAGLRHRLSAVQARLNLSAQR